MGRRISRHLEPRIIDNIVEIYSFVAMHYKLSHFSLDFFRDTHPNRYILEHFSRVINQKEPSFVREIHNNKYSSIRRVFNNKFKMKI